MERNLENYWFAVELIIESSANAATDKSLQVCVIAVNEEYALLNAKALLKESNLDVNFLKIWMWPLSKRRSCSYFR